ncbi:MAG: hypothetical protein AAFQ58_23585 [Pseudomonadota bacterium]
MSVDLGILTGLVDDIGALMAAGLAVTLAFKGRNDWEPSEEDVPKGPARVSGAVTAVIVGYLWFQSEQLFDSGFFNSIIFFTVPAVIASLLVYVILITVFTYEIEIAVSSSETKREKLIGGIWLRRQASDQLRKKSITTQKLFEGAAYDCDLIWPRISRALSKVLFILTYLILIVSGSVMLTAGAILLNNA